MSAYETGIMIPPAVSIAWDGEPAIADGRLLAVRLAPGGLPGSATIAWPHAHARSLHATLGQRLAISAGGNVVLRGCTVRAPLDIETGRDESRAFVACDKWLMAARVIGEIGTGTNPDAGDDAGVLGFTDMGYEIVFNPDGRPNMAADGDDFDLGPLAFSWTLHAILLWIFRHYVDPDTAIVPDVYETIATLPNGWAREPRSLDLTGLTVPQALDALADLAGTSWTLTYSALAEPSKWMPVAPGIGTLRTAALFEPGEQSIAMEAGAYHAEAIHAEASISEARDRVQIVTARRVLETTYDSTGDDPLLVGGYINDPEYGVRFGVDVTAYGAHGMISRQAGAPPLPWLQRLVTRIDPDNGGYVTAADMDSGHARDFAPVEKPYLWLTLDRTVETPVWRQLAAGFRIDFEHASIELKNEIELLRDNGEPELLTPADWTKVGLRITVVTMLLMPSAAQTQNEDLFLPDARLARIERLDMVPELRYRALLPSMAGGNHNAVLSVADEAVEIYADVAAELADALAAATAAEEGIEHNVRAEFAFLPAIAVGDRLAVSGREDVALPEVMVSSVEWQFMDGVPSALVCEGSTSVRALARTMGGRR